jgi:hypothetical protein
VLPNFVCIGAQKTGTTWLYGRLRQHPQVFLPETKELNFFYRDLPVSWYEAHFRQASPGKICGDISPNYMALPGVAERMHALLPDALLLCILREPLARAKSQYQMATKLGNIPPDVPFIEAFRRNLQYLRDRGSYVHLLERFTRYYPAGNQLLILLYDDLQVDPAGFLRKIFAYLGVDQGFLPPDYAVPGEQGERLILPEDQEAEVSDFYAPHVQALENYLGRPLPDWKSQKR